MIFYVLMAWSLVPAIKFLQTVTVFTVIAQTDLVVADRVTEFYIKRF